ncbi:hypothetical protein GYMLUDRAFT_66640 [Collybiopsis luxurians FD-317 M1]|nr:hypothetical protein GYMLUDRAFT_66640 [Collybiopsis luxurians FD-317 M1]
MSLLCQVIFKGPYGHFRRVEASIWMCRSKPESQSRSTKHWCEHEGGLLKPYGITTSYKMGSIRLEIQRVNGDIEDDLFMDIVDKRSPWLVFEYNFVRQESLDDQLAVYSSSGSHVPHTQVSAMFAAELARKKTIENLLKQKIDLEDKIERARLDQARISKLRADIHAKRRELAEIDSSIDRPAFARKKKRSGNSSGKEVEEDEEDEEEDEEERTRSRRKVVVNEEREATENNKQRPSKKGKNPADPVACERCIRRGEKCIPGTRQTNRPVRACQQCNTGKRKCSLIPDFSSSPAKRSTGTA